MTLPPPGFALPPTDMVAPLPRRKVIEWFLIFPLVAICLVYLLDGRNSAGSDALFAGALVGAYIAIGAASWLFEKQRRKKVVRNFPPTVIFSAEADSRPLGQFEGRLDHGHVVIDYAGITFTPDRSELLQSYSIPWADISRLHLRMGQLTLVLENRPLQLIAIPKYWGLADRLKQLPMRSEGIPSAPGETAP